MIALALLVALQAAPLDLRCDGFGSTDAAVNVVETVSVNVDGDAVKLLYPRTLYGLYPWQNNDWHVLRDVSIDDRFIRGRFTLNMLNRPSVEIDRATGVITIDAVAGTGFRGECVPIDVQQRRF